MNIGRKFRTNRILFLGYERAFFIVILKFKSAQTTYDTKGKYASTWKVSSIHSLCIACNDPCVILTTAEKNATTTSCTVRDDMVI